MKEYQVTDSEGRIHVARALPTRVVTHAVVAHFREIPERRMSYGLVLGQKGGWRCSVHGSKKIADRVAAHCVAMGWATEAEVVEL